jgi:hypothetical protein
MREPTFDIFSGGPDNDPVWLESVLGLSNARERMEQIAAKTPGQYFIFSFGSQAVLAQTDTLRKPLAKAKTA